MVSDADLSLDLIDDGGTLYLVVVVDGLVINFYPGVAIPKTDLAKKVSNLLMPILRSVMSLTIETQRRSL